ncbi:hypothetical protein [Roseimaritima ulvae]|uniref:Secreted protein n=1 Tax=Roseimaritima ulvae TaxID=980254 RepID=A0A5B9QT61_9BACT|nr:hypothetical protein [Roseimaritima ulvae]QEG40266.1 hypothetical protein UC8_22730 [Roseimaritima ulvae]
MKCCKVDFRTWTLLWLLICCGSGCTICASPDLESYTTYGGNWHRTDRDHGRVGSVFAPAGARVGLAPSASSVPDSATVEEVPSGDVVEPDDDSTNGQAPGSDDAPPAGNDQQDTKPDLRDLELEDIEVRQRTRPWQNLPEA